MTRVADNSAPGATAKQIAYIWMLARDHGIDDATLRGMTPKQSIRQLTVSQAAVAIDALKRGASPDFSSRPRGYHKKPAGKKRPPRLPKGSGRPPTIEQLEMNRGLTEWLAHHYGKGVMWVEEKLATRHYKHGGPMQIIISSGDCVERIELLKAWKAKAIKARQRANESSGGPLRTQEPQRQRSAQGVLFG